MTKLRQDPVASEIATVRGLIARKRSSDVLGLRSLRGRLAELEAELASREDRFSGLATVELMFDGGPVKGPHSIDADFAAQALQEYQDLLRKQVAADQGRGLAARGPIPAESHRSARMNLVGLVHGSFGFALEEDSGGQDALFESSTQRAASEISHLLDGLSMDDDGWYNENLPDMDERVFKSLKSFVETLHKFESTLRILSDGTDIRLDHYKVALAAGRVSKSDIEEVEYDMVGTLLGIVPIQRRFDFRRFETGEIISGKVADQISADYLERIDREGLVAGREWLATVRTKTIRRPGSTSPSVQKILVRLEERPTR